MQGAGDALVAHCVEDEFAFNRRWLRLGVCRRGHGLAVHHPGALKEILGVLGPREEESVLVPAYGDAEEVVYWSHVLDGKGVV